MKPEFEVQQLRGEDYEEWNEFVKVHKNATIFHTVEWKKVLEETPYLEKLLCLSHSLNMVDQL
jgi:hypothetical protein